MVRIVSGIPKASAITGQPEFKVCVQIETNTAPGGPQLQVRFAAPGNGGTAMSTTTVITRTASAQCGGVVTNDCGHTLNAVIDETCTPLSLGGMYCEACMNITLPASAPLATSLRVKFDLPLVFTAFQTPASVFPDLGTRFDGVLEVTLSSHVDAPMGQEFAPFLDAMAQTLSLWMTGPCEVALAGLTSTSTLTSVSEVTQGDRMCIIAEAGGEEVANIELVEVVGCLREIAPIATGERVVPSAVATESLCLGAAATTAMYGIFSLGTVLTAMDPGSLKRYDEFATDFPCSGGTGNNVCKHGVACASGGTCQNGASNELHTRAIRDFNVPPALRPLVCWHVVALVTQRSAAQPCATPTTTVVFPCETPCRPLPTLVAIEVSVPVIEHDVNMHIQYEVRVAWVPHFPMETASLRRRQADRSLLQFGGDFLGNTTTTTTNTQTLRVNSKPGFIERVGSFTFVCAAGVIISAAVLYATRPRLTPAVAVA